MIERIVLNGMLTNVSSDRSIPDEDDFVHGEPSDPVPLPDDTRATLTIATHGGPICGDPNTLPWLLSRHLGHKVRVTIEAVD
jgi:hypothetical protein